MKISVAATLLSLLMLTGCAWYPYNVWFLHNEQPPVIVKNVPAMPMKSPGTKYFFLPDPVKHTVLVYGGAAEIRDIREIQTAEPMYEVLFADWGLNPPLFILQDGTLVNVEEHPKLANPLNWVAPPHVPSTLDQRKRPPPPY